MSIENWEIDEARAVDVDETLPVVMEQASNLLPALSEVVREEHGSIAERFLKKIRAMIEGPTAKIESYGVDISWREVETLCLRIDPKTTLKIIVEKAP